MKLTDKIKIPAQVMTRQVGEETVILDLVGGSYFGLDPVGARIWQLMADGKTLAEVCEAMLNLYEVSREDIERDVLGLARDLSEKRLISPL
jgi:Coenzyme PQQ synthesis protein D (PqqD)